MTAALWVRALLTIVVSGGVLWLGMRRIARLPFSVASAGLAALVPLVFLVPLALVAAWFLPHHLVVVYLAMSLLTIALQAFILRVMCRRSNDNLSPFKAGLIATLAMLASILMGSPIAPLMLDRFFPPG